MSYVWVVRVPEGGGYSHPTERTFRSKAEAVAEANASATIGYAGVTVRRTRLGPHGPIPTKFRNRGWLVKVWGTFGSRAHPDTQDLYKSKRDAEYLAAWNRERGLSASVEHVDFYSYGKILFTERGAFPAIARKARDQAVRRD